MNKEINFYKRSIVDIFNNICTQEEVFDVAATAIANSIKGGNIVHVIGPGGHSNLAVEEVFWRAGGLAPINAILDPGTLLSHGAKRSNIVERTVGYAKAVLDSYGVGKNEGEVIIIVNAYGINPMTIDTALESKKRGLTTIGITSKSFGESVPAGHEARHPSNKNLFNEVDIFIDSFLPYGDAIVEVDGCEQKTGATSTFCNIFAIETLMIEVVKKLVQLGVKPPIWRSANLPGGDDANRENEAKYTPLIKHLA